MRRIGSGIPGLDERIGGGFPQPSTILICGGPGTGKTTFMMQSLFYGASNGEKTLYITTIGEPLDSVKSFLQEFGFYDKDAVDKGQISFFDAEKILREDPSHAARILKNTIDIVKPRRVAIDPLTAVRDIVGPSKFREFFYEIIRVVRSNEMVCMCSCEFGREDLVRYPEAYMADGIISLKLTESGIHRYRDLVVLKLRSTQHSLDTLRFDINTDGIKVLGPPI